MYVTFDHVQDESEAIKTFFFKPEKPIQYTAGQFIELSLPQEREDSRGHKRWFTLSSSPADEFLTITTRITQENGSSFKKTLLALTPGTAVNMSDPMGDFVLPKLIQTPLVFVAGGIGVTPFHSMLSWLAATNESRPIKFLYAVRSEEDIVFLETFKKANQHVTIVVSEASEAWGGERGHISADMILDLEKPTEDTLVYVSGPEPLVETLEKGLKKAGLKGEQLVLDFFPNYKAE